MIVCVNLPRFALIVAAGGRSRLMSGAPAALAPEPGREQRVGEVSPAAEGFGVRPGMPLGEALARCPQLALIPPDPLRVADAWEKVLARLESIGAAVESAEPGMAFFDAKGLARLHGRARAPRLRARRRGAAPPWLDGVVAAARAALRLPARIGAGPSRFCAMAGAMRAGVRRVEVVDGADALAGEPVTLLGRYEEVAPLVEPLERLGIRTLGALAALKRSAVADRFGRVGERAHDLARGRDTPLRPRDPGETLEEVLELPEAASGPQLERALTLLIDRLLARPERRGRTLRAAVLGAGLVEGGTWRERVVFREPLADPERMRLALAPRLASLPAPAETLRLAADRFGPAHAGAHALFDDGSAQRRERLREAVRQARTAAGPEAALRVIAVDPDSRIPERRAALAPFDP
jgi:protein ImuB